MANPQTQKQTVTQKDVATVSAEELTQNPARAMDAGEAPEGWEEEQIGFPPYWNPRMEFIDPQVPSKGYKPGTGNSFLGTVVNRDERDENFPRYIIQASRPIICQSGPAAEAEEILVQKGEFFSMSVYASLPLEDYFGMEVWVQPVSKRKIKDDPETGDPRQVWRFKLMVSPASKKLLKERKDQHTKLLLEAQEKYRLSLIQKDAENPLMTS